MPSPSTTSFAAPCILGDEGGRRISLRATKFYTSAFPIMTLGMVLVVVLSFTATGDFARFPMALVPVVTAGTFCILVYLKLVWGVVDVVVDHGDFLAASKNGVTVRIALRDVTAVRVSYLQYPCKVIVHLRQACVWGRTFAFYPRWRWSLRIFGENEVAAQLRRRVQEAQRPASVG